MLHQRKSPDSFGKPREASRACLPKTTVMRLAVGALVAAGWLCFGMDRTVPAASQRGEPLNLVQKGDRMPVSPARATQAQLLPPIDTARPAKTATATFALG